MFEVAVASERAVRGSDACYDFIMGIEGEFGADGKPVPIRRAYQHAGDPVTIGFGHTGLITIKGETRKPAIGDVISTEYARTLFLEDIQMAEERVDKYFMFDSNNNVIKLTQGQRDALVSFCFNIAEKWLWPTNNTWLRHFLAGTLTFEILSEYLTKYVNPKTQFEQGLFRRRLWELCVFFGLDPIVSRLEAWKAELYRDKNKVIKHKTDPLYVVLSADARTREMVSAETPPSPNVPEVSETPAPVDTEPAKAAGAPETPPGYEEPALPEVAETKEPEPVVVEEAPAPKPVVVEPPKPKKKYIPYTKPPKVEPNETQLTKPEFWSLNSLIFGRLLLGLGLVPAAMSDMMLDPNFQAALGGVVVIYIGMWRRHAESKKAQKKRDDKRRAETQAALDALKSQVDEGFIDFADYEAEVRDLMGVKE